MPSGKLWSISAIARFVVISFHVNIRVFGWKTKWQIRWGRETFKTRGAPESVESGLGQRCASIPSCFRGLSERSQGWHATRKPEPEPHTIDKISQASYYSARRALTARQDRECAPKIASLSLPIQNFVEIFCLVDFLLLGKESRRSRLSMKSKETQRCLQKSFTTACLILSSSRKCFQNNINIRSTKFRKKFFLTIIL